MELLPRGLGKESMPVCFLGASLSFALVSCEFSISDLMSLKSGLGDMICQFAIARQLATPLLSSRFLIFSLEEKLLWHC